MKPHQIIIPAVSGFCVLEPVIEDGQVIDVVPMPIVAWILHETGTNGYMTDPDFIPIPIKLIGGVEHGWIAIKTDTGAVINAVGRVFDGIENWLQDTSTAEAV